MATKKRASRIPKKNELSDFTKAGLIERLEEETEARRNLELRVKRLRADRDTFKADLDALRKIERERKG